MGTFLTIAFFLGFCVLIYLFFKSPIEITKNFFKGLLNFFINIIPLGLLVKNAIKEDRELAKEKERIQELSLTEESDIVLPIDIQKCECFILLNGNFHQKVVQNDISKAIGHLNNASNVRIEYKEAESVHIAKLSGLISLSSIMRLIRHLSEEYGINNTFGYLRSDDLKVFFQKNIDNENQLVGSTGNGDNFFYSVASFKPENDFVIFTDSVFFKPDLNTDFFEHLINSSHD